MTPQAAARNALRDGVEAHLDALRPARVADGGNVELLGADEDGTVRVGLLGACAVCPAQLATLKFGLEEPLRTAIPAVTRVIEL